MDLLFERGQHHRRQEKLGRPVLPDTSTAAPVEIIPLSAVRNDLLLIAELTSGKKA